MKHYPVKKALAPLILLLFGLTGCATLNNPQSGQGFYEQPDYSRIANPANPFGLQIWSKSRPLFIDQNLRLYFRTMAESYLSLYSVSSSGMVYRLFVNMPAKAGQTLIFPGEQSPVDFRLNPPPGMETYILAATVKPLSVQINIRQTGGQAPDILNISPKGFINYLGGILRKMDRHEWNTAVIQLPLKWKK